MTMWGWCGWAGDRVLSHFAVLVPPVLVSGCGAGQLSRSKPRDSQVHASP